LLTAINSLINSGHTAIIVEHNMDVIRLADWVIDLGPEGGDKGGYKVCEGTPSDLMECKNSYTGKFLRKNLENRK
ncbi:MAG: ABC transporter ATP-binding protein, partial [Rikenellaceae bacterium]